MQQKASSRTKAVVGGLLAAGLALTAAVAVAAKGPNGGGYGYGAKGRAYGHRLHCPSYSGMYHSKGRATCHMAPRSGRAATGEVDQPSGGPSAQDDVNSQHSDPRAANSAPQPSAQTNANNANTNAAVKGHTGQPGGDSRTGPPAANKPRPGDELDDDTGDEPRGRRGGNRGHGQKPKQRAQNP